LLVGTGVGVGWLTLTVGHLNILSAAFAVMLIAWAIRRPVGHALRPGTPGGASPPTASRITALTWPQHYDRGGDDGVVVSMPRCLPTQGGGRLAGLRASA